MIVFLQWLKIHIGTWWQFMADTDVPGCNFSFATLTLFIICANFVAFILDIALKRKFHMEEKE